MRFNFTILKIQRYKLSKKDTNYLKKDTNYLKINLFLSKIHNLEQLHISIFKLFDDLKISQLIIIFWIEKGYKNIFYNLIISKKYV